MDDDLIAYLERKIKTLEAERDHWKSNHDNQVKLKHEITRRPSRFVEMVREIESLKKQLAASPHWVPVAEFNESNSESIVFGTILEYPANIHDAKLRGGVWRTSYGQVRVTHVLVGLNPPVSNEDPRGDGDVDYPITPDTDVALSVEQMSDAFDKMTEVTRKMNEPLEAIRARLLRPFLGSEAEKFGAKAVAKEYTAYTKAAVELDMAISDAEQQAADDALPITQEWCASQWSDSSSFRNSKVFEIFDSISMVFNACVGGWGKPELIAGKTGVPHIKTRGQLRRLIAALKGSDS